MTTYSRETKICAVCAQPVEVTLFGSSNEFGSRDLDLRPAEMLRSTFAFWANRCPHCGYCASDISWGGQHETSVVQSDEYQAQLCNRDYPELANTFLCDSMILQAAGKLREAGFASLHAAWSCDDEGRQAEARLCRLRAVSLFEMFRASGKLVLDVPAAEFILLADLQRRSGEFAFAGAACEQGLAAANHERLRRILRYQKYLCSVGDDAAHTIEAALKWQGSSGQRFSEPYAS